MTVLDGRGQRAQELLMQLKRYAAKNEKFDQRYHEGRLSPHEVCTAIAETEQVTTKQLPFAYNANFLSEARDLERNFSVQIIVDHLTAGDASGFPIVRLTGDRADVEHALRMQWEDGGDMDELVDYHVAKGVVT